MKKTIALLLALAMCFAMAACGETAAPAATEAPVPAAEPAAENSVAGDYTYEETLPFGTVPWTLSLAEDGSYSLSFTKPTGETFTFTGSYTVDGDVVTTGTPAEDTSAIEAGFFNEDHSCPWTINADGTMTPVNASAGFAGPGPMDGQPGQSSVTGDGTLSGTYTFDFSGQMGDETFTLTLNDDGSCHLELNPMLGPWDGVYSNDGDHVSVHSLENPNGAMGKTPDLWANWFDGATGACELDLNSDGTFTFVEREGGESAAPAGMMMPGAMDGSTPVEEGYTTWTNEPYGDGAAQTFNGMMKDGPGARPVVIVVPGGAFKFVDGGRYAAIAETLCEENYLVLQLNYTVGANTYPQAIIDVKTAIQYVVDNAGPLHADVSKIYVMGSSAGGYLASMAVLSDADAFKANDSDPDYTFQVAGLVDFFGATQWMTDALYADVGAKAAESEWLGSDVSAMNKADRDAIDPLTYLDGNDVTKVWVSHGTGDTTMPILNSEQFYDGLKAVLGEENVHFEVIEGATHEDAAFYTAENLLAVFDFLTK